MNGPKRGTRRELSDSTTLTRWRQLPGWMKDLPTSWWLARMPSFSRAMNFLSNSIQATVPLADLHQGKDWHRVCYHFRKYHRVGIHFRTSVTHWQYSTQPTAPAPTDERALIDWAELTTNCPHFPISTIANSLTKLICFSIVRQEMTTFYFWMLKCTQLESSIFQFKSVHHFLLLFISGERLIFFLSFIRDTDFEQMPTIGRKTLLQKCETATSEIIAVVSHQYGAQFNEWFVRVYKHFISNVVQLVTQRFTLFILQSNYATRRFAYTNLPFIFLIDLQIYWWIIIPLVRVFI